MEACFSFSPSPRRAGSPPTAGKLNMTNLRLTKSKVDQTVKDTRSMIGPISGCSTAFVLEMVPRLAFAIALLSLLFFNYRY